MWVAQACGYVSVMREMLVRFVQTQFPTKKYPPEGLGACCQQPCANVRFCGVHARHAMRVPRACSGSAVIGPTDIWYACRMERTV